MTAKDLIKPAAATITNGVKVAAKAKTSSIPAAWILGEGLLPEQKHTWEQRKINLFELDLPRRSGILNDKELEITETNAGELVRSLASGALTSLEVVTAFCKRAAIAHQAVCVPMTYHFYLHHRPTASPRSSSTRPSTEPAMRTPKDWRARLSARCMDFRLV